MITKDSKFHMTSSNTARVFTTTTCEKCGTSCQAPNTFGAHETRAKLLRLGLTEAPMPATELVFCEALEMCTCEDCYVE